MQLSNEPSPEGKEILMNLTRLMLAFVLASLLAAPALSQDESVWEITQVTDRIYELTTDGGGYTVKVIASVGVDGVLLFDAGQKRTAEDLRQAVAGFGRGEPKFIITSHAHEEHSGGNIAFGPDPTIIAHESVRARLRSGSYLFDEFPDHALPDIGFADSITLFFNGEDIRLLAFPGAHDTGDIIAWFTESKVVCVAALSNGLHFPSVDGKGDVLKYPEIVAQVISVLPEDVTIVPGHGGDCDMADYRAFHDMLVKTTEIVRAEIEKGKTLEELQEEDVLADYASFDGDYVNRDGWIEYLVNGLRPKEEKESVLEPIYYALRDEGTEAAVVMFLDFRDNRQGEYSAGDTELIYIAYKLNLNGRVDEAMVFFELYAEEYPEGDYAYYCHHSLGDAYREKGNKDLALEHYRRSLEINPDNTGAADAIAELEAE
jgi:glyoxylase-like metal-dependent hydrolase (beta-lactamase superfamily II)